MFENTNFPKAKKYWFMGELYDWSRPVLHPMTHALHYGTSVFEGIRAYNTPKGPAVFRLEKHVKRFFHSASILNMEVPYSREEVTEAIKLVMRENELDSAYIRPLLFYSYGNLGLIPKDSPVELVIAAWEWGAYLGEKAQKGVHAYIIPWNRVHPSQIDMSAKLGGVYVQSTICGNIARENDCDEAIFLNMEGNIAEGPGENIMVVKEGVLKTNDKTESVLEGITRTSLLEIARDLGINTSIGPIKKQELLEADEVFFCGTAVELTPIIKITNGSDPDSPKKEYIIGSGKRGEISDKIDKIFRDTLTGKTDKYEHWLDYVYD
ncbi:MAG: branched-chain amino acid transaminase [Candidatus Aminicenantaceae bacterium]